MKDVENSTEIHLQDFANSLALYLYLHFGDVVLREITLIR